MWASLSGTSTVVTRSASGFEVAGTGIANMNSDPSLALNPNNELGAYKSSLESGSPSIFGDEVRSTVQSQTINPQTPRKDGRAMADHDREKIDHSDVLSSEDQENLAESQVAKESKLIDLQQTSIGDKSIGDPATPHEKLRSAVTNCTESTPVKDSSAVISLLSVGSILLQDGKPICVPAPTAIRGVFEDGLEGISQVKIYKITASGAVLQSLETNSRFKAARRTAIGCFRYFPYLPVELRLDIVGPTPQSSSKLIPSPKQHATSLHHIPYSTSMI
jgi:hypothetical protein